MAAPTPDLTFESVHREFRPRVLRYLAGFVGADEAADLTQVTMLKVSRHLSSFRGDSSLATWIYRIATHIALDRLRRREPDRVPVDFHLEEKVDDLPAALQAPSAESCAARREMNLCIREFVDALPPHQRLVIILSEVEGLADSEIAAVAGLSLGAVKIRLHRARAHLREKLRAGCTLHRDDRNEVACDRRPSLVH